MRLFISTAACLLILGCSSLLNRQVASAQYEHYGQLNLLTGDDLGNIKKVENEVESLDPCGLTIIEKNAVSETYKTCFEYKVRSTLFNKEITLTSDMNSQAGQCDLSATSESLKDPANPKAFFIKFRLEVDDADGEPKRFIQSISYGFSGLAKICSFKSLKSSQ